MKIRTVFCLIILIAAAALPACGGGGGGGSSAPPTQADVFIAFDQPVTNLSGLDFRLNNAAGATFDSTTQPIAAVNAALGSLVVGNFDPATNSNHIVLINGGAAGFDTGTAPIIKVTYAIAAGAGNPTFSIASAATFSAIAANNAPTTPPVTAGNLLVTVTYR